MWQPAYMGVEETKINNYSLFTHVLNNNYQAPCKLDVFQMDLRREVVEAKLQSRIWEIIGDQKGVSDCLIDYAGQFKTNHVLIPAGMDFAYVFANATFRFLEDAFKIIENGKNSKKL